jgi:hypothetical protein
MKRLAFVFGILSIAVFLLLTGEEKGKKKTKPSSK